MIILYFLLNIAVAAFVLNAYGISKAQGSISAKKGRPGPLIEISKRAAKFGINQKADVLLYIFLPFFGIFMGIVAIINENTKAAAVLIISPLIVILLLINAKKKKTVLIFQKNSYKLYKYILNQTAAGVRTSDALKRMYEVVSEKDLQRTLKEACAKYSVTLDKNILSNEILKNIDTPEARSFAVTIRDGLFETRDPRLMERMEQLMFNRYFAYVQRATDNVKTRCLISVVLLCSIIVVMVLIPTLMEVQNALNSIFTQ